MPVRWWQWSDAVEAQVETETQQIIKQAPFARSQTILRVEFSDLMWTPSAASGSRGDTWYMTPTAPGTHFVSWTDGRVCTHPQGPCVVARGWPGVNHTPGVHGGMATGFATVIGTHPSNLTITSVSKYNADATPYTGRYPSALLSHNGTLFYGTYALAAYLAGDCGNWCVQGPWFGFRTSRDRGLSWHEPRRTPASLQGNIFRERLQPEDPRPWPQGNDTWRGWVKFGAPQVVDMGLELRHSPDGKVRGGGMG